MTFLAPFRAPFQNPFPKEGGAAPFSPTDISGLEAWFDFSDISTLYQDSGATTPVTSDGDPIGYAGDKSGNGNHIKQSTTSIKPTYKVNIKNSLSVALFDTGDVLALDADMDLSTSYTLYLVVYRNASGEQVNFSNNAGNNYYRFSSLDICVYLPGSVTSSLGWLITTWWTMRINQNGSTTNVFRNGVDVTTASGNKTLVFRKLGLSGFSINGYVGDAFVFNNPISSGDAASLETYVNTKWAVY